jgi:hypothetical protein
MSRRIGAALVGILMGFKLGAQGALAALVGVSVVTMIISLLIVFLVLNNVEIEWGGRKAADNRKLRFTRRHRPPA